MSQNALSSNILNKKMKLFFQNKVLIRLKYPLIALALILLFNVFFSPGFFVIEIKDGHLFGSLVDILNRAAPVALLTLGMTLVIATGGIDLSVGAVMAIAAAVSSWMLKLGGFTSIPTIVAAVLVVTILAGFWNGFLVANLKIQPIIATLILMVAGRGLAQLITDGKILTFQNPDFAFIGRGFLFGIPFPITIVVVIFILIALLTRKTALGLFIESVGVNPVASHLAGIQDKLIKITVYGFSGFCAGIAGMIVTADIQAGDVPNTGLWLELDAILAVVIGGTSIAGGRFFLSSSLVAVLILQTLTTTILTRGLSVQYTLIVKAIVVILVMLLQSPTFRQKGVLLFKRNHHD